MHLTCKSLFAMLIGLATWRAAQAEISAAVVLPHGHMMLDPKAYNGQTAAGKTAAEQLFTAGTKASQLVQQLQPELILLVTPHGIPAGDNFTLYQHDHAAGTIKAAGTLYSASVNIETEVTTALAEYLASQGQRVSLLEPTNTETASSSIPLDWGEVIPWHTLGSPTDIPAVIMSLPPHNGKPSERVNELLTLGQLMGDFFNRVSSLETLVVISADLAHTHSAEGPYGTSPAAAPFDAAITQWASTGDANQLLSTAANYADEARTCGFWGSVFLQGMLSPAAAGTSPTAPRSPAKAHDGSRGPDSGIEARRVATAGWRGEVLAYGHPTYFGMMVAVWLPANQQQQQPVMPAVSQDKQQQGKLKVVQGASFEAPNLPNIDFVDFNSFSGSSSGSLSDTVNGAGKAPSELWSQEVDSDSTYAYEVDNAEQLMLIRREAEGGWRARSKYSMLKERAGSCAVF